jgi:hypothetical protein
MGSALPGTGVGNEPDGREVDPSNGKAADYAGTACRWQSNLRLYK